MLCSGLANGQIMRLRVAVTGALLALGAAPPVSAQTCADRPVITRGEPSRFELFAKAKARGNWRAKVRALPTLGAAYANWSRALAAEYRCVQNDAQYVCTATAYPCRS
jgi:hypothetical protein